MSKKVDKIAEKHSYDYQRQIGMVDSVSEEHVVARRMGFYDGFKAGAEWQKNDMLKKSVGGRYMKSSEGAYVESWFLDVDPDSVKAGTEVKLIIAEDKKG